MKTPARRKRRRAVGRHGREIDFLVEKDGKKKYIKMAWSVGEDKTCDRGLRTFASIPASERKVISTTDETDFSTARWSISAWAIFSMT